MVEFVDAGDAPRQNTDTLHDDGDTTMLDRTLASVTFALASAGLVASCGSPDHADDRNWICDESNDDCADRADTFAPDTGSDADSRDTFKPGADASDNTDTVAPSDTSPPPDTTSDDASDDQFVRRGRIDLVQDRTDSIQNRPTVSVTARFQVLDPAESPRTSCRTFDSEHCDLRACDTNGRTSSPGIEQVSAGDISIVGGGRDVELVFDEGEHYGQSLDSPLWEGQHTLTVEAAEDVAEPFSTNLSPSVGVTVTRPDFPGAFENFEILADSDLEIAWETGPVNRGAFLARLSGLSGDDRTVDMACEWPLDQKQATIPSRLLSKFTPDANVTYAFGAGDRKTLQAGDFEVTVRALDIAEDDDPQTWAGSGSASIVEE